MGEEETLKDELFESPLFLLLKAYDIGVLHTLAFLSLGIYDPEFELCPNWALWTAEQPQVN